MINPSLLRSSTAIWPAPIVEVPEENKLEITFNDGSALKYSKDYLMNLSGIRAILNVHPNHVEMVPSSKESLENKITLNLFSPNDLEFAIRLLVENEPFYQVVSEESFDNLFLFEELGELLSFFDPEGYDQSIRSIKDDQLVYMPLELAERILKTYSTQAEKQDIVPITVRIAKQIKFDSHFLSPEEAHGHFQTLNNLAMETIQIKNRIKSLGARLVKASNEEEKTAVSNLIACLGNAIILNQQRSKALLDKTNPSTFTEEAKQKLREKVNDPDPEIRALAIEIQGKYTVRG